MKKTKFFLITAILLNVGYARAQDMGVSFSFFFPKNGYFSAPVSPFSLRGVGINLTNHLALETGFSLYRMSGMNVTDLPFDSKKPLVGPFFNVLVPVELILEAGNNDVLFRLKGGVFGYVNFGTKINRGNLDEAFRQFKSWEVANSDPEMSNKPGFGYEFGTETILYLSKQFGISFGANYYLGGSDVSFKGSLSGGNASGGLVTESFNYPDSRLDYTGLEISVGVIFSNR